MKTTKKQQIIDLYENEPNISYDLIALQCDCEVNYVKSVIKKYESTLYTHCSRGDKVTEKQYQNMPQHYKMWYDRS